MQEKIDCFKIEELANNEVFIDAVTYATIIAIRNHQEEKLEALRNAVLNTALFPSAEEDLHHMFLNLVDEFTPWHLKVLKFFNEHPSNPIADNSAYNRFRYDLENAFPKYRADKEFINQIIKDISVKGLAINETYMGDDYQSVFSLSLTKIGEKFMAFLRSPI